MHHAAKTPSCMIDDLFEFYFNHEYNDLEKLEDGIYYICDASIQGQEQHQYEFITNDKNLIKIYDGLVMIYQAQLSLLNK